MVIWVRALAAAFVAAAAASAAGGGPEHNFAGKNTFSPTGRLVQQEYVDAVVAGGPACVGVLASGQEQIVELVAFRSSTQQAPTSRWWRLLHRRFEIAAAFDFFER